MFGNIVIITMHIIMYNHKRGIANISISTFRNSVSNFLLLIQCKADLHFPRTFNYKRIPDRIYFSKNSLILCFGP